MAHLSFCNWNRMRSPLGFSIKPIARSLNVLLNVVYRSLALFILKSKMCVLVNISNVWNSKGDECPGKVWYCDLCIYKNMYNFDLYLGVRRQEISTILYPERHNGSKAMVQEFIKTCRWDHLLIRVSKAKMTTWSLANCAEPWTPSFTRNNLVKRWKVAAFHWAPSRRMMAIPDVQSNLKGLPK